MNYELFEKLDNIKSMDKPEKKLVEGKDKESKDKANKKEGK